jgi:DNA (cytosine-5)-methyltransferase 1
VTLKILDLFSGLGGFSLGLERTGHFKTIAFCDNDKYCNLVLQKHWKGVKIYNDVREITKEKLESDGVESPDIITGGFPCQPFSVAGKQKGTSDDRHLWPEMFRIIKAFKPRFVIGENVPGIVNIQDGVVFETVCTDLESQGYEVQPFNIPAAAVGAPHQRKRIWIIATLADSVSNDERREISRSNEEERRIQEEHRQNNSTTRKSSRTSEIRNGDNRHEETKSNVAESESVRFRGRSSQERGIEKQELQQSEQKRSEVRSEVERRSSQSRTDDANTNSERLERLGSEHKLRNSEKEKQTSRNGWWHVEPNVGRVAHGVQGRVHRLKGLGNSIVPQIVEEIGYAIIKAAERKE